MTTPKLYFSSGPRKGQAVELNRRVTRIGRSSKNEIKLNDEEASRFHCEVRCSGETYFLVDCESSNGTFLNGEKIQLAELRNGDLIQVGQSEVLYTNVAPGRDSSVDMLLQISRDSDSAKEESSSPIRTDTQVVREPSEGSSRDNSPRAPVVIAKSKPNLDAIFETLGIIRQAKNEKGLLTDILRKIFEITMADRGGILLLVPETGELRLVASAVRGDSRGANNRLRVSETIVKFVLNSQQGVLTSDARDDDRWNQSDSLVGTGVLEAICVPLQGLRGVLGIVYVDTQRETNPFSSDSHVANLRFNESHLNLVIAVAQQAAMALEVSRYYTAMLEAERLAAVGQMAATMSHNIKNTMQGINSGAYLLDYGVTTESWESTTKGWNIVKKYQESMFHLFDNLLSYSRPKQPIIRPTETKALLEKVIGVAAPVAAREQVELKYRIEGSELHQIPVDCEGIFQALTNLVLNAIDATLEVDQPQVSLVVQKSEHPGRFEFVVEDNGQGIPTEYHPLLFSQFFTSKGQKGNGLGLISVKKTVDEHLGTIAFESAVGVGTRFVITLPLI